MNQPTLWRPVELNQTNYTLIPNAQPSFEKLNDSNYNDWHYMMFALLVEKDLWDIVDGTETCPTGSNNAKGICPFVKK